LGRVSPNWSDTNYDGQGGRRVTNGSPDGSVALGYYQAGLLQSVSRYQNDGGPLGLTSLGYDEYGRLAQTVDAGLGTTTNAWDPSIHSRPSASTSNSISRSQRGGI
jgi:hypothetical protein